MRKWLIKFIDLIFYSNLWIALAALAMALQTQLFLFGRVQYTPYLPFLFCGTLFLYAIHRIVGLQKAKPFQGKGRYKVIATFKSHIQFYAGVSALVGAYFFFQLEFYFQLSLFAPALLSLAYVIPLFRGKKRLRDFHFIKIFLIALVWSWLTVVMPALYYRLELQLCTILMFLERVCFVFAITLPFDIRDLEIDRFNKVKTIPFRLGIKRSKAIALVSLTMALFFAWLNYYTMGISLMQWLAYGLSGLATAVLILKSSTSQHDYFYTGLMDGTMILQAGLVFLLT
ncbi:MAG: UbiA family prenyltransferase [Saprospiraceae bacterium]|nr:UbiA family prenyltransferase [Saprospiraceae bacterium]